MSDERPSRRRFLRAIGATGTAGIASLAGCSAGQFTKGSIAPNMKPMMSGDGLNVDVVKGAPAMDDYPAEPNDEGFVDVLMVAYENDTNNYHFMPHVAWVEPGTTVRWHHTAKGISERRTHTVTAVTPDLMGGYPRLIPEEADEFDSGFIPGVGEGHPNQRITQTGIEKGPFTHTFEEEGVYMYVCQNHYGLSGMAGAIVVGEHWKENKGTGWDPAMTASLSDIPEVDPVNGPTIQHKIAKPLRGMVKMGKGMEE